MNPLFRLVGFIVACCLTIPLFAEETTGDFASVRGILQRNCIACHHAQEAEGGLNLETTESILSGSDSGVVVQPGQGKKSLLWRRMSGEEDSIMPPEDNEVGAHPLTEAELELMARWIDAGVPLAEPHSKTLLDWQPLPESLTPIYATASSGSTPLAAYGRGQQVWLRYFDGQGSVLASMPLASDDAAAGASADIVSSLAVSRDGQRIAVGGFRKLDLWQFDGSPKAVSEAIPAAQPEAATFVSRSGGSVAQVLPDTQELIVHQAPESEVRTFSLPATAVRQILWSADESRVAAALEDGSFLTFESSPTSASEHTLPSELRPFVWWADDRIVGLNAQQHLEVWKADEQASAAWVRDESFTPVASVTQVEPIDHPQAVVVALAQQQFVLLLAADGSEVSRIDLGEKVSGFALQSDGKRLASFAPQGLPRVWDVANGKPLGTLPLNQSVVGAVESAQQALARQQAKIGRMETRVEPLQKTVATQTEAVTKAEEEQAKAVKEVAAKTELKAAAQQAVEQAEQATAAAKESGADAPAMTGLETELKKQQEALEKAAMALAVSQDTLRKREQILASTRDAKASAESSVTALMADLESEKQFLAELQNTHDAAVARRDEPRAETVDIRFTPDGRFIVACTSDGQVRVMSSVGLQLCATLHTDHAVTRISTTAEGMILGHRGDAAIASTWPLLGRWEKGLTLGGMDSSVFEDRVTALDFDASSQQIAAGSGLPSRSGHLTIFDVSDGTVKQRFEGIHTDSIMAVAFAPDARSIASAAADKLIRVSRLDAKQPVTTLEGHGHHILALAWHHDGNRLVTASADQTVRVWDVDSMQAVRTISGFTNEVTSLRFVGQTDQLAVAAGNSQLRLINMGNGATVRNFSGSRDYVYSLSILNGEQWLLTGDHSGNLTVWNLATGSEVP